MEPAVLISAPHLDLGDWRPDVWHGRRHSHWRAARGAGRTSAIGMDKQFA